MPRTHADLSTIKTGSLRLAIGSLVMSSETSSRDYPYLAQMVLLDEVLEYLTLSTVYLIVEIKGFGGFP